MKNILKNSGEKRGSALLIALLMMGVLMTLTLGISTLVLREIRVTQSIVDANKAYYAAEAGVERALYELSKSLPGLEPKGGYPVGVSPAAAGVGAPSEAEDRFLKDYNPGFTFNYQTSNRADSVPSFPGEQPIFIEKVASVVGDNETIADCQLSTARSPFAFAFTKDEVYRDCARTTYRKLALNETHIIPLFSAVGDDVKNVNDFLIQYYLNIKDGSALYGEFAGLKLESFDVLRWKIYGKPLVDDEVQRTESIADFYPGVTNNSADRPICIGTNANIKTAGNESCIFPSLSKKPPKIDDSAEVLASLTDVTLWSAARECYQTDAGVGVTGGALIKGTTQEGGAGCQMRDFIDNHKENYLILTNMVNPNIAGISNMKDPSQVARADIYYRVLSRPAAPGESADSVPKLVKDFAEIKSEGSSANGQVVKSLDVRYKAPGFLPVFNFSLYKTKESVNSDIVK